MDRKIRVDMTVTLENEREPMLTIMQRITWPENETLAELEERLMREACRKLHQPRKVWRLA